MSRLGARVLALETAAEAARFAPLAAAVARQTGQTPAALRPRIARYWRLGHHYLVEVMRFPPDQEPTPELAAAFLAWFLAREGYPDLDAVPHAECVLMSACLMALSDGRGFA